MTYPPQPQPDPRQGFPVPPPYNPTSAPPVVSGAPYGQPYPPAAGQQYPQQYPSPKKRKKWPWIVGGILVACILGCVGLFTLMLGGTTAAVKGLDDNEKGKNAVAGQMNIPIKDGKFEFTVTGVHCGVPQVGDSTLGEKAQGAFCLVDVTITNVGKDAEIFDSSSQKAYDAKGTEFSTDGGAEIYANDQNQTFLEQINPGNKVEGALVFDVPKGTKLASIVLHESFFTPGVRIPLK